MLKNLIGLFVYTKYLVSMFDKQNISQNAPKQTSILHRLAMQIVCQI